MRDDSGTGCKLNFIGKIDWLYEAPLSVLGQPVTCCNLCVVQDERCLLTLCSYYPRSRSKRAQLSIGPVNTWYLTVLHTSRSARYHWLLLNLTGCLVTKSLIWRFSFDLFCLLAEMCFHKASSFEITVFWLPRWTLLQVLLIPFLLWDAAADKMLGDGLRLDLQFRMWGGGGDESVQ